MALVRFGDFETDLQTGELFRQGRKNPLEDKPFQLLAILLERPGQLVTREDLRRKIWPPGTYVDFSRCVNIAVTKLRHALSDSSDTPRYVETLPKRGYRLIASVEEKDQAVQLLASGQAADSKRKLRLAILPFVAFCDTPDQAYFTEWLIDEVISQFGSRYAEHIGLIARTSHLRYNTTTKSVGQIGRDLKVDHILTGTARILPDRVQLTAQLTAVSNQAVSWSENYDCSLGDVLMARSELATKITRFVGRKVLSTAVDHLAQNKDAYLEYIKGCYCHAGQTASALWKSIRHFERAIQLDPTYAPAYSGLANARGALGGAVMEAGRPVDFYQQAKEAALRALEITNKLPDCHISLAIVKFFYEWDWVSAERALRRAIELDPTNSLAHQIYTRLLSSLRREDNALEEAKRICALEPLSAQAHFLLGEVWYCAREYEKALNAYNGALELNELHSPALVGAANAYVQLAVYDQAVVHIERAHTLYPERNDILASLGSIYARAGRIAESRKALNKLRAASKEGYVSPFDFGVVAAGLGQKEKALECLHRAYEESSPMLVRLLSEDARFDDLRNDSRYTELLARIRSSKRTLLPQPV